MSQLAIKGHATRGREVIQLLKMLGGENKYSAQGNCTEVLYFIYDNKSIKYLMKSDARTDLMKVFTLEEFESEFPYKIEDKVIVWIDGCRSICNIQNMEWDSIANEIKYKIQDYWYSTINLQPYKEETMEERKYADLRLDVDQDDKLATEVTIDGNKITPPKNYLIGKITKVDNGMLIEFVKKQPQYPKDYEECESSGFSSNPAIVTMTQGVCINSFAKLTVIRNTYWKLAGKEMGLDKPWKPDWEDEYETYYTISYDGVNVKCYNDTDVYSKLAFPTKEMRDAFYENFKSLIEECKELL